MNSTPQGRENEQLYFVFVEYTPFLLLLPCDRLSPPRLQPDSEHRQQEKETITPVYCICIFFITPSERYELMYE